MTSNFDNFAHFPAKKCTYHLSVFCPADSSIHLVAKYCMEAFGVGEIKPPTRKLNKSKIEAAVKM